MPIDSTERRTSGERTANERKESNDDKSATAATALSTEKPPRLFTTIETIKKHVRSARLRDELAADKQRWFGGDRARRDANFKRIHTRASRVFPLLAFSSLSSFFYPAGITTTRGVMCSVMRARDYARIAGDNAAMSTDTHGGIIAGECPR